MKGCCGFIGFLIGCTLILGMFSLFALGIRLLLTVSCSRVSVCLIIFALFMFLAYTYKAPKNK